MTDLSDEYYKHDVHRKLKQISTPEAVVNYFKEAIKEGRLSKGDLLPSEQELQRQFQISRVSLREGRARLAALGIIKVVPGKGAFVSGEIDSASLDGVLLPFFSSSDGDSLEDLLEARSLIEGRVAVLAADRRTDEDLAALREILDRSKDAIDDGRSFGDLDYEFHIQLAGAARNVFLKKMLSVINGHVHLFLKFHAKDSASRVKALASHRSIFECVAKKRSREALKIMQAHIKSCMDSYRTQVLEQGKIRS